MSAPPDDAAERVAARVAALGALLRGTDVTLLELRAPGETIRLTRPAAAAPAGASPVAAAPADASCVVVRASAPGLFLARHPARGEPLAVPGRVVRAGEAVALLRVGALLLHVPAPVDGTVLAVLAPEGEPAGNGTPLLHLARSATP